MRFKNGTIVLEQPPSIRAYASVVGKKEGEGPLGNYFDVVDEDTTFGEQTWEKAESRMQQTAVSKALTKAKLSPQEIELLFAGDLLNQCIGSAYGLRDLNIPFYGLYGACSTMAESLSLASIFVGNNIVKRALAVTSSHFCSAERQFRQPLEYGGQRPPTAQWTATGSGAIIVEKAQGAPYIKAVTTGKIVDLGVKDINNMGAAMAPAAHSTIKGFLEDSGTKPTDYDLILTGDLGTVGSDLLTQLLMRDSIDIASVHNDCGKMLYDLDTQDVHAGGSGCGCSASVLCSYILQQMQERKLNNILFVATGALMSTTSFQQGESIPGIAHLVHLCNER